MKKLILFLCIVMAPAFTACKKSAPAALTSTDEDRGWTLTDGTRTPNIHYIYDARVEECYYYASQWTVPIRSDWVIAGAMVLQPLACTDKIKAVAETIGAAELPQTTTAP